MDKIDPLKIDLSALRKKAEEKLHAKESKRRKATALKMEHDLNTHKVELEMQNEELRATHLKLKHSVDEFIQFFDYAPMAYFILNKDGVIKNLNIKACDLIGNPIKAVGKPISTYIDGEANQDDFYRQRNHIFETSVSNQIESKIRKKDGTICHVLIETSFIKDENNNFKHLLSAITDITSQKKAEQQLQYKINELNTFTYKVTHDLRSPFASLTGLIKLAKEIAKQPELKEYFDMIDKSVSRMDRLLIDLVSIVNVSQGKLNVSVIDFEKIVNEIIDSLSNQPRFSEIIIKKNIKSETLFFQSDERLIYSILQNIIDNAIKYRNEYSDNDSSITIDIFVTNKIAKINITDNGIGIPSELQSKIFDMFYRATTKSSGTGLGLYIVKGTVEKLGGEISLQSELNSGTAFFIKLPNIKE